jgi:monothiol glutaredoxin
MSSTHDKIAAEIAQNDIILFMKGSAKMPLCGFSGKVAGMLTYLGVPFKTINVLEDQDIREGIKAYSQWPTIPQLYIKGEFIGGCDITTEMFQSGELQELLKQKGFEITQQG